MIEPILAEHELQPGYHEIVKAEAAAAQSLEHLRNATIILDHNPREEIWLTPAVEPPLETDIEMKIRVWGTEQTVTGWASRRFAGGSLTFWVRHKGRSRFVSPIGWRVKA